MHYFKEKHCIMNDEMHAWLGKVTDTWQALSKASFESLLYTPHH
jgi:hypothetical protein